MTDKGVHRQVLELGMPMAVAMCLLETDVARVFTDAGMPLFKECSNVVSIVCQYLKGHVCKSLVTNILTFFVQAVNTSFVHIILTESSVIW